MEKTLNNDLEFKNGDLNGRYDPDEERLNRSIQRYKNNLIQFNSPIEDMEVSDDEEDPETYRITLTQKVTSIKKLEEDEETDGANEN